jgi:hypothetical protein
MEVTRGPAFWRALQRASIAMLLLLAPAATAVAQQAAIPELLVKWPDTIYVNGVVASFNNTKVNNDPGTMYEAVAVRDGLIIALGTTADIQRLKGKNTRVIDLEGKMMLPGFVHSHNHIFGPAEQKSFDIFSLNELTPGYYLDTGVEWTAPEIKEKVKTAVDQLRAKFNVGEEDWIGVKLFPDPDKGFPSIATASNLMGTYEPADAEITQADLDAMVSDRRFELTVAAGVQDRPRRGFKRDVWYKLSAGEKGAPVWQEVMNFAWTPWVYDKPVKQREVIDFGDEGPR